jgi:hypothetical protein
MLPPIIQRFETPDEQMLTRFRRLCPGILLIGHNGTCLVTTMVAAQVTASDSKLAIGG